MSKIIFLDVDGTLIDSSDRMYNLFCELIPECQLTKCEYWNYKRNKISHQILLDKLYPQHSFEDFNSVWMNKIESEYYLGMDYNYLDTKDVLEYITNPRVRNTFPSNDSTISFLSDNHAIVINRTFLEDQTESQWRKITIANKDTKAFFFSDKFSTIYILYPNFSFIRDS